MGMLRVWPAKLPADKAVVEAVSGERRQKAQASQRGTCRNPGQGGSLASDSKEGGNFIRALIVAWPLLDRIRDLHYTTRFDSVRFGGLKGRILCRNARFNRKFAAVTKRTAFARA